MHLSRKCTELSYLQHSPTFPAWSGTCIMVLTELLAALPGKIRKPPPAELIAGFLQLNEFNSQESRIST